MLIIWLQGIWLPLHGYSFERTPLWAGIYMIPLTVGFLARRPRSSGWLSDRFGARPFATGGMLLTGGQSSWPDRLLPIDFNYCLFAAAAAAHRPRHGPVRRAQHRRDHELPAGRASAAPAPG